VEFAVNGFQGRLPAERSGNLQTDSVLPQSARAVYAENATGVIVRRTTKIGAFASHAGPALGLQHLESFKLGMSEIKAFAGCVAGTGMSTPKRLGFRPRLEGGTIRPNSV
jgi:hypothetical protein